MAPLRLLTYCCVYLFACVFYVTSDLVWTLNWTSGPIFTLSSCLLIPTQSSHLPFEPAVPLTAKLFLNTLHELSFFLFLFFASIPLFLVLQLCIIFHTLYIFGVNCTQALPLYHHTKPVPWWQMSTHFLWRVQLFHIVHYPFISYESAR